MFTAQPDDGSWLDFSDVSDVQLEMLVGACGELEMMQKTKFSSSFDVHGTDILEHIRTNLFCDYEERGRVKVELQQLDVHGNAITLLASISWRLTSTRPDIVF